MVIYAMKKMATVAQEMSDSMRAFGRELRPILKNMRLYQRELKKQARRERRALDMQAWFAFMEDMLEFLPRPAVTRAFAAGGLSPRRRMVKKKAKAFMKALFRHPEHLRLYEAELTARERRLFNEQLAAVREQWEAKRAEMEELLCSNKPIVSGGSDN